MKHVILLGLAFLLSLSIGAQEVITLVPIDNGELVRDNRSLPGDPTAVLDGNTITIYSEKTWEQVYIYVVDKVGNVQYEVTGISLSGCYTFSLVGVPQGVYTLILQTEMEQYEGDFSL